MSKELQNVNNTNDERARLAAYALNLCTVSVSQIVDYNDPIIMEQEYDAIINNLNLQNMPKEDEALLDILEKLMDTITFFRINEKEKDMVERDYQVKMKNAVWNAVPNFGMIVSGEPITMAISLATQVGIGYMNYRKSKVENSLEYDREMWQLERAAIEQINSLRRQLFDAAWKMARTYGYDDKYRLTERQIRQYNEILQDDNIGRKFDRLFSIKDYFEAYPAFWYYLGNTANTLAKQYLNSDADYSKEISEKYRTLAGEYYEKYFATNKYALLREDIINSASCLEYIDILDPVVNVDKIRELIGSAIKSSGGRLDILQLCVFAHLKIGQTDKAKELLNILVNEKYNRVMNGQLLSRIIVSDYIHALEADNKSQLNDLSISYSLLKQRVKSDCLYPMPINSGESWEHIVKSFEKNQKVILIQNYYYALKAYFEKFAIRFNHILPIWTENQEIPELAYSNSEAGVNYRNNQARKAFNSRNNAPIYCMEILESEFWKQYLELFDEMAISLNNLSGVYDIEKAVATILLSIKKCKSDVSSLINKLNEASFSYDDYLKIQNYSFYSLGDKFIEEILKQIITYITKLPQEIDEETVINICDAEADLRDFCLREGLNEPSGILAEYDNETGSERKYFEDFLWGEPDELAESEKIMMKEMVSIVNEYKDKLLKPVKKSQVDIIIKNDPLFKVYFSKIKGADELLRKAIMIVDDKSLADTDLVFTTDGIYPVVTKKIKKSLTSYGDIRVSEKLSEGKLWIDKVKEPTFNATTLSVHTVVTLVGGLPAEAVYAIGDKAVRTIKGDYYDNKEVDMTELYQLIERLDGIHRSFKSSIKGEEKLKYKLLFDNLYESLVEKNISAIDSEFFEESVAESFNGETIAEFGVRKIASSYIQGVVKKGTFSLWDKVLAIRSNGTSFETKILAIIESGKSQSTIPSCKENDDVWIQISDEHYYSDICMIVKTEC